MYAWCLACLLLPLQYRAQVRPEYGAVILDTIYPATAQHIQKHTTQERHMVRCSQPPCP
jgi:hypothetical protein